MIGVALSMIIESVFMLPLMLVIAECAGNKEIYPASVIMKCCRELSKNMLVIAVILGFLATLFQIKISESIGNVIDMFA